MNKQLPTKGTRKGAKTARGSNQNAGRNAPVAISTVHVNKSQSGVRVEKGSDRLAHVADVSIFKEGDLVLDLVVEPSILKRLAVLSKGFQRIKWSKLKFHVDSQVGATCSGGYVVAFITDPTDTYKSGQLAALSSNAAAKTTNWWQSSVTDARTPSKPLYTTADLTEPRLSYPGRFIMMCDGKATQAGSMTVHVDWTVALSQATVEEDETEGRSMDPETACAIAIIGSPDPAGTNPVLTFQDSTGGWYSVVTVGFPQAEVGDTYRASGPAFYQAIHATNDVRQRYTNGFVVVEKDGMLEANIALINGDGTIYSKETETPLGETGDHQVLWLPGMRFLLSATSASTLGALTSLGPSNSALGTTASGCITSKTSQRLSKHRQLRWRPL